MEEKKMAKKHYTSSSSSSRNGKEKKSPKENQKAVQTDGKMSKECGMLLNVYMNHA